MFFEKTAADANALALAQARAKHSSLALPKGCARRLFDPIS
jgi:hypothetical protein